jgi:hypothetical protein
VLKVPPAIRGECLDEYIVQWPLGDRPLPFESLGVRSSVLDWKRAGSGLGLPTFKNAPLARNASRPLAAGVSSVKICSRVSTC